MRVAAGKVIVRSPGRNFVTLKLETKDGIHGPGDATLDGREPAVASHLRKIASLAAERLAEGTVHDR